MMFTLQGGPAARMARRELGRHKARSALIIALVMLPVFIVNAMAVGFVPETELNPEATLSGANAVVTQAVDEKGQPRPDTDWTAIDRLPQRKHTELGGTVTMTVDGADYLGALFALDFTSPDAAGRWARATTGLPGPDQVVLTKQAANRFELDPGEQITVDGKPYTVTGTVRTDAYLVYGAFAETSIIVGPDHPLARSLAGKSQRSVFLYGDEPTASQLAELQAKGLDLQRRSDYIGMQAGDSPSVTMQAIFLAMGAIITVLTSTVAGAAFAIGIRQQRRSLALLSATGAPARTLQRTVVGQGVLLGTLGAVLGAVLGVAAGMAFFNWRNDALTGYPMAVRVAPGLLVATVLVAVLGASVAAWLPARQVARQDVLTAVRDAEAAPEAARWPVLGLVLLALAALVAVVGPKLWPAGYRSDGTVPVETVIGPGAIVVLLLFGGLLACVPAILDLLGRAARRGPLPLRLALRDGARNRARATAGVAASAAIASLFSLLLTAMASMGQTDLDHYSAVFRPGVVTSSAVDELAKPYPESRFAALQQAIEKSIGPVAQTASVREPRDCTVTSTGACEPVVSIQTAESCDPAGGCVSTSARAVVFTPELFELMTGTPPTEAQLAMVQRGGALAPKGVVVDGKATLQQWTTDKQQDLPAVEVSALGSGQWGQAYALVPEGVLARALPTATMMTTSRLFGTGVTPTLQQVDDLERRTQQAGLGSYAAQVERGPHSSYLDTVRWLGLAGAVLMLAVAAVTGALALHDARDSLAKLAAIGASSWSLRAMNGVQTLVSVGLGVLLGTVVGTLPLAVMVLATRGGMSLGIPWAWLGGLLFGVPLASALLALVFTRPPLPRTVRID